MGEWPINSADLLRSGAKDSRCHQKRTGGKAQPLAVEADWRKRLGEFLVLILAGTDSEAEEKAREEKAIALEQLAHSRFSVLIGPAGTGKTTLLSILCGHAEVSRRIDIFSSRLRAKRGFVWRSIARTAGTENFREAMLAQFDGSLGVTMARAGRYLLRPDIDAEGGSRTVIVDEASMLTEEDAGRASRGYQRRSAVDLRGRHWPAAAYRCRTAICRRRSELEPDDIESQFPRVAPGYVELTIPRRPGAADREDLQLASWFAARANSPGDDQIFDILTGGRASANLRFVQWNGATELEQLLSQVLAEELSLPAGTDESDAFAQTVGGGPYEGRVYFHAGRLGPDQQQLHGADRWQISARSGRILGRG